MAEIDTNLVEVTLSRIRPTQMTAGYRQVQAKEDKWKKMSADEIRLAARNQFFPGVVGPKKQIYITDHHHTALAILRCADVAVRVGIQDDLSALTQAEFWVFMDHRLWVHSYDVTGRRRPFKEMPAKLLAMADDPYRSLAADVRSAGGFAKSDLLYLEFLWANFFRNAVSNKLLLRNPKGALKRALKLAASSEAQYLPGWAGKD